jgi:spore maturation protein A
MPAGAARAAGEGAIGVLNVLWVGLLVGGVLVAAWTGHIEATTSAAFESAKLGVETVIGLTGIMIFWLGVARVAEQSGLMDVLAAALRPLFRLLFPSLPPDSAALRAISLNVSANLLGLGQAATPFGLKAMQEMQRASDQTDPETASDAMITFLVLNTAGVTLIPATVVAYRAAAGSAHPTEIVGTTLAASLGSTICALALDVLVRRRGRRRRP